MTQGRKLIQITLATVLAGSGLWAQAQQAVTLLNVSYDPTRELYVEYNAAFATNTGKPNLARMSPSSNRTAAPASRRAQ